MRIGISPDLFTAGGFVFTWHGLFTLIAVILGVYLATRWARHRAIDAEAVFSAAVWAIIGGIIGARVVHIIDLWSDYYRHDLVQVLWLWNGGLDVLGAILGGLAAVYIQNLLAGVRLAMTSVSLFRLRLKVPLPAMASGRVDLGRLRTLMDVSALVLPITLAVGRIGGIINGAQVGRPTEMPWRVIYTHPRSPTYQTYELRATHPAVAYELLWNLLAFGLLWYLRDRIRPNGMLFALFLVLYATGRFFIGFFRYNKTWLAGMGIDQLIALVLMIVAIPLVTYRAQLVRQRVSARAGSGRPEKKT